MSDERLSQAAKCVATVLLLRFRNHKTSVCNPSFNTIAKCVGRKRSSVIEALNQMKAFGWMDWDGTAGGSPTNTNNFQFFLKPQPVRNTEPVRETEPVRATANTGAEDRTQPVRQTGHEPSIEPSRTIAARCALKGQQGVRVHSDSAYADGWRRYWSSIGQVEPAFSRRDGYYLKPLPSLTAPEPAENAA
jgi:hypothetical protein